MVDDRERKAQGELDPEPREERLAFWVLFLIGWGLWFMGLMSVISVLLVIALVSK